MKRKLLVLTIAALLFFNVPIFAQTDKVFTGLGPITTIKAWVTSLFAPIASPTLTGTVNVGTTTTGGNENIVAGLSANLVTIDNSCTGWTGLGAGGWNACVGNGTISATNATGYAYYAFTSVVGATYKVTYTITGYSGSGYVKAHPGASGSIDRYANGTYTEYDVALTTAGFNFQAVSSFTGIISNVSVQQLTSGSLTVDNGITMNGGRLILPHYADNTSFVLTFANETTTGLWLYESLLNPSVNWQVGGNETDISKNGIILKYDTNVRLVMGASVDTMLWRDAANTYAFRNGTTQQVTRFYNTYTNTSNYERLSITGVQGVSSNLTAESLGSGSANLDIVLTPLGTGMVKAIGALVKSSGTANTGGGLARRISEATATLSGGSTVITLSIPSGAKLDGVQLRVDTDITGTGGAVSWTAAYSGGSTTAITTGQVFTKNTKVNYMQATYELATNTTNITITPNAGTFTGGVVRAVAYYEDFIALSNNP